METIKVLAKLSFKGVSNYVADHLAVWLYNTRSGTSQLGVMQRAYFHANDLVAFSSSFFNRNYGADLQLTSNKVDQAIKIISSIDKISGAVNENEFLTNSNNFKQEITAVIKETKKLRATNEPKTLDAVLTFANDVYDDFISMSKKELVLTYKQVYKVESESTNIEGKFKDDYMRQRFGLTIRLFATLVDFVRENRIETTSNGQSMYPYMSVAMETVIKELQDTIKLLSEITVFPKNPIHDLPNRARATKAVLQDNGFAELGDFYAEITELLAKNELTGQISNEIEMLPKEVLEALKPVPVILAPVNKSSIS